MMGLFFSILFLLVQNSGHIHLDESSTFAIYINTNIKEVKCWCDGKPIKPIPFFYNEIDNHFIFSHSKFNLPIKNLNCGNYLLNAHMFQILGKESSVNFQLKNLNIETFEIDKKVRGVLNVNINNINKDISFVGIVDKNGEKYRFKVEQHIKLSDFNIHPNHFLLDVKNEIKILLDVKFTIV